MQFSVNYLHLGIVVQYKKVCNNNWLSRETHYCPIIGTIKPSLHLPNTLFSTFWLFKINAFPMRYEIWKGRKQVRQKVVSNPGWLRQMSTIHALSSAPLVQTTGLRSAPKNGAKYLLNGNGGALNTLFWWRKCCNYGNWEGHSLCSFWRIFGAWWNRYKYVFNTEKYAQYYSHCACRPE